MRRDVCGWCGCALRPRDRRADRAAVVCRRCGTSMLVTRDADVAVFPATLLVHGTSRALRVRSVTLARRGLLRRTLALGGTAVTLAACAGFARLGWSSGGFVAYYALCGLGILAPAVLLPLLAGPARALRFSRGGVRRGRDGAPGLVRAVLVEEVGLRGPLLHTRRYRVVYVDAAWRRRRVAWMPWDDPVAALELGRAIHRAVGGDLGDAIPLEVRARTVPTEAVRP